MNIKIYALRNDTLPGRTLAYLFYYPRKKSCYIEIPYDITEWELPCVLDHFVRQGVYTVDSRWTLEFIRGRIVPPDRQNLGLILREAGLKEYDEFALFKISDGRCAQDDCYIREITESDIPEEISVRRRHSITTATRYGTDILCTLGNGNVVIIDLQRVCADSSWPERIWAYVQRLTDCTIDCGGNGILIGGDTFVTAQYIYEHGVRLPVRAELLRKYAFANILTTSDVTKELGCSRQNLDDMNRRGVLRPECVRATTKLYYSGDMPK